MERLGEGFWVETMGKDILCLKCKGMRARERRAPSSLGRRRHEVAYEVMLGWLLIARLTPASKTSLVVTTARPPCFKASLPSYPSAPLHVLVSA